MRWLTAVLVCFLGHDDFKVREAAEQALVALNVEVPMRHKDPEVAWRLRRVRARHVAPTRRLLVYTLTAAHTGGAAYAEVVLVGGGRHGRGTYCEDGVRSSPLWWRERDNGDLQLDAPLAKWSGVFHKRDTVWVEASPNRDVLRLKE